MKISDLINLNPSLYVFILKYGFSLDRIFVNRDMFIYVGTKIDENDISLRYFIEYGGIENEYVWP